MSSWAKATGRWFSRWLGGAAEAPALPAGERSVCTGAQAVLATEILSSERVYRVATPWETRAKQSETAGPNVFGQRVAQSVADDSRAALALAEGRTLAGARAAALIPEGRLGETAAALAAVAARHAPLLAHAVVCADTRSAATLGSDGHAAYHALASTGAILGLARNAQRAVDMTLVARRAAELALTPAVICQEGPELAWAPQSVELPDAHQVRRMLGGADDSIESPTRAQSMLLGERRRRVPRWFDPDRPAAHGMQQSGRDLAAALAGQRDFFAAAVEPALRQSIDELQKLTGRRLELVSQHRLEGAKYVFVTQGSAIDLVEAIADHLGTERKEKVGVLGIEWLRPLAADEIRDALAGARVVTVLERGSDPFAIGGPLFEEISRALGDTRPQLLSATYGLGGQALANADVLALFENMKLGAAARPHSVLGVSAPSGHSEQPRREALEQKIKAAYPELEQSLVSIDTPFDLRPKSARTIALWARRNESPEEVLDALARSAAEALGAHVKSRTATAEQGAWMAEVTVCPEPLRAHPGVEWHDVAVVAAPELPFDINPLRSVVREGFALVATPLPPVAFWRDLPASWRQAIVERELAVYVLNAPVAELVEHVPWLLGRGEETKTAAGTPLRLDVKSMPKVAETSLDAEPPLAVRRFGGSGSGYENVARFWGELALPRIEEGAASATVDPYLSLAAVPPSTSGLFHVAVHKNRLPQIDAARCVGCGACWTACPDSSIVPGMIRTEALLDAAHEMGKEPGQERSPVADKLKRAHKQLAQKIDSTLAKSKATVLDEDVLTEAFGWLIEQMKVSEEDRPAYAKTFAATLKPILRLSVAVTEPMFHAAHAKEKGSGELLALAVNPAACQGCGGCSAVCAEEAISVGGRTDAAVDAALAGFRVWEQLPDPSGESIAKLARDTAVGHMPAVMTSRHTLLAVTGGGGHEPGSGSRLGARLVVGVAEYHEQRAMVTNVGKLDKLADRLHDAIKKTLAASIPSDDLVALDAALEHVPNHAQNVGTLVARLESLGERATVDGERARRLVRMAREVHALRDALVSGADGMGRSRFGLVVASPSLAAWAAEFPRNPFAAPSVVELGPSALDLAVGLAEGLRERHLEETKLQRLAELLITGPSDLPLKEHALERLTYADLTEEERRSCPPLVVLAGPEVLGAEAGPGLGRILATGLPIKIVVLDGRERLASVGDALLPVVVSRRAYVLSSTVAHREHLFTGTEAAFAFDGPALLHVYAPSPSRHGFDTAATVERARLAVECRVHPMLRFDPSATGVFGTRLDLDGNPDPGHPWAKDEHGEALTPAHFARGESRYAASFSEADGSEKPVADWAQSEATARRAAAPSVRAGETALRVGADLGDIVVERLESWQLWQELGGLVTPFTDRVRTAAEADVAGAHAKALADLEAEYQAKLAELERTRLEEAASRLGARFLSLAGYGKNGERPS